VCGAIRETMYEYIISAGRLIQQSWTQLFRLWWTLINTFQVYGRFKHITHKTWSSQGQRTYFSQGLIGLW